MKQRTAKIDAERSGVPASPTPPAPLGTALGVLSAVLDHDGQQISATQTRHRRSPTRPHRQVMPAAGSVAFRWPETRARCSRIASIARAGSRARSAATSSW